MKHADVILELPGSWMDNPIDGSRHVRFYMSIVRALGDLGVTVRPLPVPLGADDAPRLARPDQLVISFHSRGPKGHVLRAKESYVPPFYTLDRLGYSGFSELGLFPQRYRDGVDRVNTRKAMAYVEELRARLIADNVSKYRQGADRFEMQGDYIFVPLQTVDDPVTRLCDIEQIVALEEIVGLAAKRDHKVVVKRHPFCASKRVGDALDRLAGENAHLVRTDASIHAIIHGARAVVGANSGVLFEALIHGAHVVTFGGSDFRMATTPATRLSALEDAIFGGERVPREAQARFVAWFLQSHCVQADDLDAIRGRIAIALSNLDIAPDRTDAEQRRLFAAYSQQELRRRDAVRYD